MAPSKRAHKRSHRAASHSKRSKRSAKRSAKRSHRSKRSKRSHKRSHTRRRGGAALHGAPLGYSLAGDWSSQRSMGQGADYLKYHVGQHGGAFLAGAPVSMIAGSNLPASLQSSAHVAGTMASLQEVAHLRDQAGGKRSKRAKKSKRSKRAKKSKRSAKRSKRSRGGSLHGAPLSAPSMLLARGELAAAGLSPEWRHSVEESAASARQGL